VTLSSRPRLTVIGGLPGTGKTTLARQAAKAWRAVYLRIDTIEQALLSSTALHEVGPAGYAVARAQALDNLRGGLDVVADCVNPLPVTRMMWQSAAAEAGADLIEIEVVCSDPVEHRRRIETRIADIAGHRLPSWRDVTERDYAPWDGASLQLDTAGRTPAEALLAIADDRNRFKGI
jgi:predicted kinase